MDLCQGVCCWDRCLSATANNSLSANNTTYLTVLLLPIVLKIIYLSLPLSVSVSAGCNHVSTASVVLLWRHQGSPSVPQESRHHIFGSLAHPARPPAPFGFSCPSIPFTLGLPADQMLNHLLWTLATSEQPNWLLRAPCLSHLFVVLFFGLKT